MEEKLVKYFNQYYQVDSDIVKKAIQIHGLKNVLLNSSLVGLSEIQQVRFNNAVKLCNSLNSIAERMI